MLGFKEMVDKLKPQLKQIEATLDGSGHFHPAIRTPEQTPCSVFATDDKQLRHEIRETFDTLSLSEFLAKSGTAGIAGAVYMVPDKLHDTLLFYSKHTDKPPILSAAMANGWQGGDLKVNVVNDESYKPQEFMSGGSMAASTMETKSPTISPIGFGIPIMATQDLVEDNQYDLVEFHVAQAAKAMGEKATSLFLAVILTATDGWGTVNAGAGDSSETKWAGSAADNGISEAIDANLVDGWISNTIVTTGESWTHSISETLPTGSTFMPVKEGFTHCVNNMDILLHTNNTDLTETRLCTLVFDRYNAAFTGRKRWMQVENYANPVDDIAGAVVTCRQDTVTLYNDAIFEIKEAA